MTAPSGIIELVEKFKRNEKAHKEAPREEQNIRTQYIDPFFRELGWDVGNKEGSIKPYQEVFEHKTIGSSKEKPDYTFHLSGEDIFFVEAKDTKISLASDKNAAFQIRKYGFIGNSHLSIITNFKEFAIYDTRYEPKENDKVELYRLYYFKYDQYEEVWDIIENIFSKDAVLKGNYENYFLRHGNELKGAVPVDEKFLKDLKKWRKSLAINIALKNKKLNEEELNYIVQQIMNSILFLRISEDKGIISHNYLKNLQKGEDVYVNFIDKCQFANKTFNDNLFHFSKKSQNDHFIIKLPEDLIIDDKTLRGIFEELYYPVGTYDFSKLSQDILGKIYELFSNEIIRLDQNHNVKIESNDFDKKRGIYFTPKDVTKNIVQNTVGKLIDKKSPEEISEIKILDPCCGSGSFLLEAYHQLLDYHLNYYMENNSFSNVIFQDDKGNKYLTLNEKWRILTNNIFGVDINPRATEITKFFLLLTVLEHLNLGKSEEKLPNLSLDSNIICGNSIIDFKIDDKCEKTSHFMEYPFDYQIAFSKIFNRNNKGFDIIIGNPPYILPKHLGDIKGCLSNFFNLYDERSDIQVCFFEKSLNILKKGGILGFVFSMRHILRDYGIKLREDLSKNTFICRLDVCDINIFKNGLYTGIIILKNTQRLNKEIQCKNLNYDSFLLDQNNLDNEPWIIQPIKLVNLRNKIKEKGILFKDNNNLFNNTGIVTGKNKAYVINEEKRDELLKVSKNSEIIKPVIQSKDIPNENKIYEDFLINTKYDINVEEDYPVIYDYLLKYKNSLQKNRGKNWYNFRNVKYYDKFDEPKIIYPEINSHFVNYFDIDGKYDLINPAYFIYQESYNDHLKALSSIFSSNLINFYIKIIAELTTSGFNFYNAVDDLPIIKFDNDNKKYLISIAEDIHQIRDKLHEINTELGNLIDSEARKNRKMHRDNLLNQLKEKNKELNKKVYELYDLEFEEIKLIEEELVKWDSEYPFKLDNDVLKEIKEDIFSKKDNSKDNTIVVDEKDDKKIIVNDDINIKKENVSVESIINKIKEKGTLFENNGLYNRGGIVTGKNSCFTITDNKRKEILDKDPTSSEIISPLIEVSDITSQKLNPPNYFINPKKHINVEKEYPAIYDYLHDFETELKNRSEKNIGDHWYNFGSYPDFDELFIKPKIIYPEKNKDFVNFFDENGKYYLYSTAYFIYHEKDDLFYLKILSLLLSSNLMNFYIKSLSKVYENDPKRFYFYQAFEKIHIIDINKDDPSIKQLNEIADNLLEEKKILEELEKKLKETVDDKEYEKINNNKQDHQKAVDGLKKQINMIVYDLYEITELEQKIIEEY